MIVIVLFATLIVTLALGIPIAVCLGLSTMAAILVDGNLPMSLIAQRLFTSNDSFSLLAVPFFMLAGSIMTAGGISKRLVEFAGTLVGWIKGGLAMVATVASMFFAAISGSSSATCAAVGSALIPEMNKKGYNQEFTAGVITAAGTTGIVIPPSVSMVLYAVAAGISVGDALASGIIPGILMGLSIIIVIYYFSVKRDYPAEKRATLKDIFKTFLSSFWGLLTPVIIIGGIYGGIFTATEAAAASVVYALFASCVIYRELKLRDLPKIILSAVKGTAIVMFIMNAAGLFSWMVTVNRIPQIVTQFFLSITDSPYVILLLINLLLLFVGTFLNASAAVIILAPILVPVVVSMGIDPVHFGALFIVNLAIGTITPPVGVDLFVVQSITDLPFSTVVKNIIPFMLALFAVLIIVTYIPQVSLFIPKLFN